MQCASAMSIPAFNCNQEKLMVAERATAKLRDDLRGIDFAGTGERGQAQNPYRNLGCNFFDVISLM